MDIDLADLRAIATLAETLHFGRAADRLHVSQRSSRRGPRCTPRPELQKQDRRHWKWEVVED